ncbi:hypothetical protein CANCADRAFT_44983 [Tortispora caseinolytica NRRL Y-17796]|uniref:Rxt3-domain-containing protein n=1 Tax=Tortispora caseinolytica NRRL Y-17796 TaxID=767744 RepID=A0A1E4TI22_9ASCO|nr:hypothetical protein CANCADRAFT_44983 [Tortispora caseinolytica NRRL Y-17796]
MASIASLLSHNDEETPASSSEISEVVQPAADGAIPVPAASSTPGSVYDASASDRRRQVEAEPERAEEAVARVAKKHVDDNNKKLPHHHHHHHHHHHRHHHHDDSEHYRHHHHHHHHHHHWHGHRSHSPTYQPQPLARQQLHPHGQLHGTPGDGTELLEQDVSMNDSTLPAEEAVPETIPLKISVNNAAVFEAVKNMKQSRLGILIYTVRVTPSVFLPRYEGKENSIVEIHVPHKYLNGDSNPRLARREVWGTDIYTDDSDPVAAAIHAGFIAAVLPESSVSNSDEEADDAKGTADAPALPSGEAAGDVRIVLRILPRLERYRGCFRNGIRSRTWGTVHDGMSYCVEKVNVYPPGKFEGELRLRKQRLEQWVVSRDIANDNNVNASLI